MVEPKIAQKAARKSGPNAELVKTHCATLNT
jgi:hypothetical protein